MKIENLGADKTALHLSNGTVFFSYNTPVCARINGQWSRTEKKWSVTTSRHINQFLDGLSAETRPQEFFDNLS